MFFKLLDLKAVRTSYILFLFSNIDIPFINFIVALNDYSSKISTLPGLNLGIIKSLTKVDRKQLIHVCCSLRFGIVLTTMILCKSY